jgi:peptidoglycan-associated lipoprotein
LRPRFLLGLIFAACLVASSGCAAHRPEVRSMPKPSAETLAHVHFPTASDRVVDEDRWILERSARWMRDNPHAVLILEGHCDERGSDEYNMELGDRRSRRVKQELMRLGVPAATMAVMSYGEGRPLDAGHAPVAWRKNRRVQFTLR